MRQADVYVGIDPDVDKSGVGIYNRGTKVLSCCKSLKFFDLFISLKELKKTCNELNLTLFIRIEAGWLNKKSNFHGSAFQKKSVGERIAKNVGSNHEVGRKIGEMCEFLNLEYEFVPPMGKVTPEYFKSLTGIEAKKKDQDMIDAALLVWGL